MKLLVPLEVLVHQQIQDDSLIFVNNSCANKPIKISKKWIRPPWPVLSPWIPRDAPRQPDRGGRGLSWLSPPACNSITFIDQWRLKSLFDFLSCPFVPLPPLHVLILCVFTPRSCRHVQLQGRSWRYGGHLSGGTGLSSSACAGGSATVEISSDQLYQLWIWHKTFSGDELG